MSGPTAEQQRAARELLDGPDEFADYLTEAKRNPEFAAAFEQAQLRELRVTLAERQARIDSVTRWCDAKEADTRRWMEKHNPRCECEVGPTTLDLIDEVRAALSAPTN